MIVAGTGHRPGNLGGYDEAVTERLVAMARRWLAVRRPTRVISGMALGWDQALAQAALDIGIPMTAAVPFDGFDNRWPHRSREAFNLLLGQADEVHIVSDVPSIAALHRRNEWMVDRADMMLALWDGSFGGTFNCIRYAKKKGTPIENLWPEWSGDLSDLLR